jgi:hypothetical protein
MRTVLYTITAITLISALSTFAAKLEISQKAQEHIVQIMRVNVNKPADLLNPAIIGIEEIEGRPVVFEVVKAKMDDKLMQHFFKNVSLPEKVVFNTIKGAYCYNNIALQQIALKSVSIQDLSNLKTKASVVMEQLLGNEQAARFVFANEETDYVKESDTSDERILRKTYRFTRKINGRHILDNTSFVRLSFSADQELSAFEIVNPDIKPLRNVERLVKMGATEMRLKEYAANKKTAVRNGPKSLETIGVTFIKVEDGFDTYLSKKAGEKTHLLPNISFYSDYQLENGEHFENWSHFCLDADYVPNIDQELIEGYNR